MCENHSRSQLSLPSVLWEPDRCTGGLQRFPKQAVVSLAIGTFFFFVWKISHLKAKQQPDTTTSTLCPPPKKKNPTKKNVGDMLRTVAWFRSPCGWLPAGSSFGQAPGYCWKEVDQNSGVLVNKCLILLTLFWFTHSAMRGCWRRCPAS